MRIGVEETRSMIEPLGRYLSIYLLFTQDE